MMQNNKFLIAELFYLLPNWEGVIIIYLSVV